MSHAEGVLPDKVSRDPRSESWLVFVDFVDGADVRGWLQNTATPAVRSLTAARPDLGQVAVCTTAFGAGLFDKTGLPQLRPSALNATLPSSVPADAHDLVFYVFALSDAVVAEFLRTIDTPGVIKTIMIERGYQRSDKREIFGQLDGLRNIAPDDRAQVAFVGAHDPEPEWARGGSSFAYLKITQNRAAWTALDQATQEAIIGRRISDGSRLDLPPGTDPTREAPVPAGATIPAPCAHIRKAGPRGPNQDTVRIFRRGTPFIETTGGVLVEGLQFVSYQASIDDFLTIFSRWMLNPDFPTSGAGVDSLLDPSRNLLTITKGGIYFAIPHDPRYLGAGLFDPTDTGTLIIHLNVTTDGVQDPNASLEGATFTITNTAGTLATITTDAAGHAAAPGLPLGVELTITQTAPAPNSQPAAAQTVTLTPCRPTLISITNTRTSGTGGGGYA